MYITILSAFTWPHLISIPLMFSLSVKSHLPAEGFPLCKQSLLCVWNWRGQHSSAQASNRDPDSCRNSLDFPPGVETYPLFLGSCRPWQGQSVSLWSQAGANRLSPEQVYPVAPQLFSVSCADDLPGWGNTGLFWIKGVHRTTSKDAQISQSVLDYQSYMCFLGGLWIFKIFVFKLDSLAWIKHHQLF